MEKLFLDEFYEFLKSYADFYKDFLMLESEKYQSVCKNDFSSLDAFIKKEQIFLLKSKNLEKDKDAYLGRFGAEKLPEIIAGIGQQDYKNKFLLLHKELSKILLDLKEANRVCNFLIGLQLQKIEHHVDN
jgi:hypothetical protein